jgi:hypothetical protein
MAAKTILYVKLMDVICDSDTFPHCHNALVSNDQLGRITARFSLQHLENRQNKVSMPIPPNPSHFSNSSLIDQTHGRAIRLAGGVYVKNLAKLRWEEVRYDF